MDLLWLMMFVLCCCYSVLLSLGLCMDIISRFLLESQIFKPVTVGNFGWSLWKPVYVTGINVVNENVCEKLTFGMIFWLDVNWILSHSTMSCFSFAICKSNNHSMLSPSPLFCGNRRIYPLLVLCPLGKKAWNRML